MKRSLKELIRKYAALKPITCVDAGARGGFDHLPKLNSILDLFAFEPEPNAFASLNADQKQFARCKFFQQALAAESGTSVLHLSSRPSMSSLLQFDEELFESQYGFIRGSEQWKEGLTQGSSITVRTTTIDDFFASEKLSQIDFLKLDTQGTELEILKGAKSVLTEARISVIKTEVSLIPVYKNQVSFSELDLFLNQHGYILVNFQSYPDTIIERGNAVKQRGKLTEKAKAFTVGDAVYVLKSELWRNKSAALGFNAGLVLAHLGCLSQSAFLLENVANVKEGDVATLFNLLSKPPLKSRVKEQLRDLIPPKLLRLLKQV